MLSEPAHQVRIILPVPGEAKSLRKSALMERELGEGEDRNKEKDGQPGQARED
jgi:hypothetical protein